MLYSNHKRKECFAWQKTRTFSSRSPAFSTITDVSRSIGKVGYIANSPQTKAGGTESASRIYERVPKRFYVRVLFTTCTKIICRVEFSDMSDLNAELESQAEDKWDDWDDEDDKIQF